MKFRIIFSILCFFVLGAFAQPVTSDHTFRIAEPGFTSSHASFDIQIIALRNEIMDSTFSCVLYVPGLSLRNATQPIDSIRFHQGIAQLHQVSWNPESVGKIQILDGNKIYTLHIHTVPDWFSILPPLVAIVTAILFRQVMISLFLGVWLGATLIHQYNPFTGILRTLDHYFIQALATPEHVAIVLFTMTLGGMVGIITRSGGTAGIVSRLSGRAVTSRSGQIATWAMGLIIFFDDYANTLIVGNTMRPITDKLRISREKLSFLVDATAAPVASLAVFSTWIGFELGLIADTFDAMHVGRNVYWTFLQTIPFRFYSLFMLILVFWTAWQGREFGPMLIAERRSKTEGKVLRDGAMPLSDQTDETLAPTPGKPLRAINAFAPIAIVIIVTLIGLIASGRHTLMATGQIQFGFKDIIGSSDPFSVLMWSSFSGALVAGLLAVSQKILSIRETVDSFLAGAKSMLIAMMILLGAWSIGQICQDLKTADFVIQSTKSWIRPGVMPAMTFLIAALISFSTGTSWGTLSILIPIVLPIAHAFSVDNSGALLVSTLAAVLSGSVFGDHCSPISDTTIMSSMASGADHIDHVRTQMPYALLVAVVALVFAYLPAGFGISPVFILPVGLMVLLLIFRMLSRKV